MTSVEAQLVPTSNFPRNVQLLFITVLYHQFLAHINGEVSSAGISVAGEQNKAVHAMELIAQHIKPENKSTDTV